MTRITRSTMVALVALAILTPVATAMPSGEYVSGAGATAAPQQDHRGPDARDASVMPQTGTAPGMDFRSADARDAGTEPIEPVPGLPTWPLDPESIAPAPVDAAPVADGDDTSPLVYILPGLIVSVLLAAGMGYAVLMSGRARRARIGA